MIADLFNDAFRYYGHTALSEMSIHHMTREVYENMDAVKAWRMDANKQNSPPIWNENVNITVRLECCLTTIGTYVPWKSMSALKSETYACYCFYTVVNKGKGHAPAGGKVFFFTKQFVYLPHWPLTQWSLKVTSAQCSIAKNLAVLLV